MEWEWEVARDEQREPAPLRNLPQNSDACPLWLGGVYPKCRYASGVATRPRGVRCRNPCCTRNGSYTSSIVVASSPIAAPMLFNPTGPPSNFSMIVLRIL